MPIESEQPQNLRASVIDRFSRIATTPNQERKFPVGPESAKKLGYDASEVDSFPVRRYRIILRRRQPVLSGRASARSDRARPGLRGGIRCAPGGQEVGPNGKVIGLDMTPEMIAKARHNASLLGVTNVDVPPGGDRVTALSRRLGRSGDLQRRASTSAQTSRGYSARSSGC